MITSTRMGALLSVVWDWSNNVLSKKESRKQEAFKYNTARLDLVSGVELDYPFDIVDTKLRVRGSGRAMVLRYDSVTGKDFVLIGHSIAGQERTESETRR